MGLIGTIATFGIGYAAGALTGKGRGQQVAGNATRALQERFSGTGSIGSGSRRDRREIRQVMTAAPDAVHPSDSLQEAADLMKRNDIGDVIVEDEGGKLAGIVTDRDLAIRAIAEGRDPKTTTVRDVYTPGVTTLAPTDTVEDAVQLMRSHDVRRLPVVESGRAIGIVSLGDVAVETDTGSVLADISTASPDR